MKTDAAARKIQSKTYACIDHTAAPDQLPAHVEIDVIAPVVAPFSRYRVRLLYSLLHCLPQGLKIDFIHNAKR